MRQAIKGGRSELLAAIDVGSSKVCCLIARRGHDGRPRVFGIGQQVNHGLRGGAVTDVDATETAIVNAVQSYQSEASGYSNSGGTSRATTQPPVSVQIDQQL